MTSQPADSTPTREVQRAYAQFKQALAMLYQRHALLNAEMDLWPDQCQGSCWQCGRCRLPPGRYVRRCVGGRYPRNWW